MPYVVADRVKETTTTTGTGNLALAGAVTGFRTFNSAIGVNNTTTYVIVDATGSQWEVGFGTLGGSSSLTRTFVFSNSAGTTTPLSLSAGTKTVFVSMSAAPRSDNTFLGTNLTIPLSSGQKLTSVGWGATCIGNQSTVYGAEASTNGAGSTAIGATSGTNGANSFAAGFASYAGGISAIAIGNAANAGNDNSIAIGVSSAVPTTSAIAIGPSASVGASAAGSIAIGNSSSSPEVDSVALGNSANASLGSSTVIGASANSFGNSGTSVGKGASVQGTSGITIGANSIGWTDGIAPDSGILIGTNSNDYNGITIGHGSNPSSGYYRNIIIGHGISPAADDATYMNKFRTGVTPVGTEWTLKWDDSTNEVYASLGGSTGPNWYAYQVQPSPGSSFSVDMPSGMPTGSFGFGNSLFSTQSTFSGTPSPSGAWTYLGTTGYYNAVYAVGSPQPSPESYSGSAFGVIIIYYRGYETDSGATSTVDVNTGTSLYSSFTNNIYCSSFSTFGTTQYGHAIVAISGSFVGSITPSSGVTLVEEFYDSGSGNTYAFFDLDSSAVSLVGSGAAIATITSSAGYDTIFWYNYV